MRFDLTTLPAADRYKLMASSITPRPIAWVSSLSVDGVRNLAPYSFFNMVSADPPLIVLGVMPRADGTLKDTAANIEQTGEFIVHLVSEAMAEAMNFSCIDAPPGFDEIAAAELEVVPGEQVQAPRLVQAPVAMECRLYQVIEAGQTRIILGEVVAMDIRDEHILDGARCHIDPLTMNLIARLHGAGWYTRSTDLLQMTRPVFADWQAGQSTRAGD
jgi:flavin reductase (DIM6/NTAB) family NADH-FMN oxidoreductase RutF